jgi:aminotransferase in exopolysaccharide biosynthesis
METEFLKIEDFIRKKFKTPFGAVPLHEPRFYGNEKKYISECIDSTFVSSVGKYVTDFEKMVAGYTHSKYAVAAVNGTSALHVALILCDVKPEDEVLTQALTFIATANAISYTVAKHVFIDVDLDTLGLSSDALRDFLEENTIMKNGFCFNKVSGRRIKACVPMHTFGHPCRIDEIISICDSHNIDVIEDSAESLGSIYKGKHTGTFGKIGISSFNGNKTITTGGGGMIFTQSEALGKLAKHLTTTAKIPHKWEFNHDMIGYNYRLTNLAAALGCAQMEQLSGFLTKKRQLASDYETFFSTLGIKFLTEPANSISNYWLNTVIFDSHDVQVKCLEYMNSHEIMTRPAWLLMNKLIMYHDRQCGPLKNSEWLADRMVNIPSSVIPEV